MRLDSGRFNFSKSGTTSRHINVCKIYFATDISLSVARN